MNKLRDWYYSVLVAPLVKGYEEWYAGRYVPTYRVPTDKEYITAIERGRLVKLSADEADEVEKELTGIDKRRIIEAQIAEALDKL